MATAEIFNQSALTKSDVSIGALVGKLVRALASLKLTVALLAMAVFIVFAGTMAQVNQDIWEVVDQYFRCAFAWIPLQIFFPPAFFPSKPEVGGGFWFPGGWLIGFMMAVNLVAAHGLRFTVQASGPRLWAGIGVLGLGALTTWLVIASGSSADGVQSQTWLTWDAMWLMFKLGLTVAFVGVLRWITWSQLDEQGKPVPLNRTAYWGGMSVAILLGVAAAYLWIAGQDAQLDASSMRILWQLIKGTIAGVVLLVGCVLVFKKRAGIVLIHSGIGLMMFSELLVGLTAVESQITLQEGEQTNFARDIRNFELAVVTPQGDDQETHAVIAGTRLLEGFVSAQLDKKGEVVKEAVPGAKVSHELLPFDVQLVSFSKNADVRRPKAEDKNLATDGLGKAWIVEERQASTGTDSDGKADYSAAYVKLTKKGTDEPLGTYLASVIMSEEGMTDSIDVDGKSYDLSLRFTRHYKPYTVELLDVRKDDYIGTDTPRNYSSDIHLIDAKTGTDLNYHVWMNNPLRYAGETFYQSGYHKIPTTGIEGTSLALVTNTGWMIPYVACMIVAVGLLAHFAITLLRFLDRRQRESSIDLANAKTTTLKRPPAEGATFWVPIVVAAGLGLWIVSKAKPESKKPEEFDLAAFGQIPVVEGGRVKPLDTYARNTLRILSGKETFYLEDKDDPTKKTLQPAIRWLADVIARPDEGARHKFIRIDNLDTIEALGLKNRKGFTYSPLEYMQRDDEKGKELMDTRLGKVFLDANKTREKNPRELSVAERKLIDFDSKHSKYDTLTQFLRTPETDPQMPQLSLLTAFEYQGAIKQAKMPLVIPPAAEASDKDSKDNWKAYSLAAFLEPIEANEEHTEWATSLFGLLDRMKQAPNVEPRRLRWAQSAKEWLASEYSIKDGQSSSKPREANPAVTSWKEILKAYAAGDARGFNKAVANYRAWLERRDLAEVNLGKVGFESFFNHFQPFMLAAMVYLFAFLAAVTSWLKWERTLSRTAFAMICLGLVVHTFAMVARIYISGRPPVTNLYSSAVFIGWGTVVLGMVMEIVFRNGIGNVVAGATGFGALLVSHYLAGDGDTFTVLQAVLDTQFWLATHVTTINLGYATTFLAGALGVVYVLRSAFSRSMTPEDAKNLSRMIYGTLCFGIFFSFVGTVLGGLWADDSWGRFWGWDPKENGALIILLWTALVLHARWDGMVKDRGMAVLAIVGNITTSWSWFGVNELGVGLHSYGFTEGVLLALGLFIVSQLIVIVIGCLPRGGVSPQST